MGRLDDALGSTVSSGALGPGGGPGVHHLSAGDHAFTHGGNNHADLGCSLDAIASLETIGGWLSLSILVDLFSNLSGLVANTGDWFV